MTRCNEFKFSHILILYSVSFHVNVYLGCITVGFLSQYIFFSENSNNIFIGLWYYFVKNVVAFFIILSYNSLCKREFPFKILFYNTLFINNLYSPQEKIIFRWSFLLFKNSYFLLNNLIRYSTAPPTII